MNVLVLSTVPSPIRSIIENHGCNCIERSEPIDVELLKKYRYDTPYFLSGGIGPTETAAIKEFLDQPESDLCFAIDVNSKFEIKPGLKDKEALINFMVELGYESKEDVL